MFVPAELVGFCCESGWSLVFELELFDCPIGTIFTSFPLLVVSVSGILRLYFKNFLKVCVFSLSQFVGMYG